jgi:uncharacterized membrane protein
VGAVLILIGAVALFAAIVGGGIKIRDIEVGSVPSLWRQGLLGVFGIFIGLIGLGLVANPNGLSKTEGLASNGLTNNIAAGSANLVDANSMDANAMDNDTGPAAPVAESAAPREEARNIYVRNSCGEPIKIWLAYNRNGQWMTAGSWSFAAGEASNVENDGITVATAMPEVYFYAKSTTSATEWSGNTTVGDLKNLLKGNISVDDSGRYLLDLTCN